MKCADADVGCGKISVALPELLRRIAGIATVSNFHRRAHMRIATLSGTQLRSLCAACKTALGGLLLRTLSKDDGRPLNIWRAQDKDATHMTTWRSLDLSKPWILLSGLQTVSFPPGGSTQGIRRSTGFALASLCLLAACAWLLPSFRTGGACCSVP